MHLVFFFFHGDESLYPRSIRLKRLSEEPLGALEVHLPASSRGEMEMQIGVLGFHISPWLTLEWIVEPRLGNWNLKVVLEHRFFLKKKHGQKKARGVVFLRVRVNFLPESR